MIENIRISFQGIWAHKLRSILTMLGIIIGIGSIISIVSTIKGTNEQIKQNLVGAGNNAVNIQLYNGDWPADFSYESPPEGIPAFDEDLRKQLLDIPEVTNVSFYHLRREYDSIYRGAQSLSGASIYGIDRNFMSVYGYEITSGRAFTQADYDMYRKVVLLDKISASNLFPGEDPIGKTVEIKGEPFTVIGLTTLKTKFQPVFDSLEDYSRYQQERSSGLVLIPDTQWPVLYQFDEPQAAVVQAAATDDMTAAGEKAAKLLNGLLPSSASAGSTGSSMSGAMTDAAEISAVAEDAAPGTDSSTGLHYQGEDLLKQAEHLQQLSAAANQQLIWIASISLLVGGIGVMNIMLVSVTERTREIGLKKALGARKTRILAQFLTEAAVLTGLGGILGIGAGIGMAYFISGVSGAPVAISIPAIIVAVLFSTLIGIIFGIIPSVKAAGLSPIEALRHE